MAITVNENKVSVTVKMTLKKKTSVYLDTPLQRQRVRVGGGGVEKLYEIVSALPHWYK